MTFFNKVEYRYFFTDLLSNTIISEIPLKDVSFERTNRKAGSFSAKIPFIPQTKDLNIYEATMPGRTGVYILRNNVCVWGGIIWARSYQVDTRELSIDGSEFISYLYHRNIWQTLVYGTDYSSILSYQITDNVATITTDAKIIFSSGEIVEILGLGPAVNGFYKITEVVSTSQFKVVTSSGTVPSTASTTGICRLAVDTYELARDLILRISDDLAGVDFVNDSVRPSKQYEGSIISYSRDSDLITLKTENTHSAIPGQEIKIFETFSEINFDPDIPNSGVYIVKEVPDENTVIIEKPGPNIPTTSLSGRRVLNVVSKQAIGIGEVDPITLAPRTLSQATLTLEANHGASVNQTVLIENVDSFFDETLDVVFNGQYKITFIPSLNKIGYTVSAVLDVPETPVNGGTVSFGSRFIYGEYGSFVSNSDIGIFSYYPEDGLKSGFYQETKYIFGFEQKTVGEILEEYSSNIGGFDYRIDCDYNYDTSSFERIFRLIKTNDFITTANGFVLRSALLTENDPQTPEEVEYPRPIEYYNAQNLIFEYPGNISTFSLKESAENAATRFFVVGSEDRMSDDVSQPYAAAAALDYLNNPIGPSWPILDQTESINGVSDPESLYEYSVDYLNESLPPTGEYSLSINGSLDPQVGSYNPGDWCSIIINDEFIRQRLENDQEPRDDLLVRKIDSIKVSVPDFPGLPEDVNLTLIADWKVDRRSGN